jgi:hypothetical protein
MSDDSVFTAALTRYGILRHQGILAMTRHLAVTGCLLGLVAFTPENVEIETVSEGQMSSDVAGRMTTNSFVTR